MLIKVQACVRSFLARKRYALLRQAEAGEQSANNHYSLIVESVLAQRGPFIYENHPESEEMLEISGFKREMQPE